MTKPIRVPDSTRELGRASDGRLNRRPVALGFFYSFCFSVFAALYLPVFILRGKHRTGVGARFGRVPASIGSALSDRPVLWVHGVSVGEIVQAFRLVAALRERRDGTLFVVTSTTAAGLDVARRLKDEEDVVLPFPADFRFAVRRFVESVLPRAVIILETEIWPNLIFELTSRRIPVYIVNGRISDRAIGGYRLVKPLLKSVLRRLEGIGAQDELSRARFVELGADEAHVRVTGNMKFDWQPPAATAETDRLGGALTTGGRKLFIAGSTHDGEEALLFDLWRELRSRYPELVMVVAPRHPERCPSVLAAARERGIAIESLSGPGPLRPGAGSVYLLDTMGLLAGLYKYADVVFVGGSLVPVGGHNLVEPAFYEKPVLFGPYMQNFKEMAAAFVRAEAGFQVDNGTQLKQKIAECIEDRDAAGRMGQRAKALVQKSQGATARTLESILQTVNDRRQ